MRLSVLDLIRAAITAIIFPFTRESIKALVNFIVLSPVVVCAGEIPGCACVLV
jgi:hypothetical protein